MQVIVDQNRCVASGQCVLAAGAVFDQQEDGTVFLLDENPPPELHDAVRRAAALCPVYAISFRAGPRRGTRSKQQQGAGRGTRE